MERRQVFSMTLDEVAEFKRIATGYTEFSDRISLFLAMQLQQIRVRNGEDIDVLEEIRSLESKNQTYTKKETQFKFPPLYPLWHKHYSTYRHTRRNIAERWNINNGSGNRDFDKLIVDTLGKYGQHPEEWQKKLAYEVVIGGLSDRSKSHRMTGDWIIFAKHEGQNFYLGLAPHEAGTAGQPAQRLFEIIKSGCAVDFPFLFID